MTKLAPTVIIADDEKQIRRFVRTTLEADGYHVFEAETGQQAVTEAATRKPDLLILDLGLPDMDGVQVMRQLREWSNIPVIVLSARSQENDKIVALDAGADDYLTKPFSTAELLARIRAQLRRQSLAGHDSNGTAYQFGNVKVDLSSRLIFREEEQVHLTPIEFKLLSVLLRNAGRVVTQRQLLNEVWGPSYVESSHYLRIYMGHLRQKLETDPAQPRHLITETGVGYRLVTTEDPV